MNRRMEYNPKGRPPLSRTSSRALLATLAATLLLSGCHVTVGSLKPTPATSTTSPSATHSIPRSDLEQITSQKVRDKSGGGPIVINCPGDLAIKLDASEKCTLAQDGRHFEIRLKITKVSSPDDATWDWQVEREIKST